MVRGFVQEHVFKHPWERVTAANWRKYTDTEHRSLLSHVVEVDTIERTLDRSRGELYSTRAITVNAPGPWWLQRLMGDTVCHCLEQSTVNAGKLIHGTLGFGLWEVFSYCSFLWTLTPQGRIKFVS
jgi:hypothetical protein